MPLTVQDVVRTALKELPAFLGGRQIEGVRVEEVFPPRDGTNWRVTLSHLEPGVEKPKHPAMQMLDSAFRTLPPLERVYHVLEVHPDAPEVLSMRLREEPG